MCSATWPQRCCPAWLAWWTHTSAKAASEHVRVARALGDLPLIDAAFAANNLSVNVVVEIDSLHSAMESVRRGFGVGATTMSAMQDDLRAGTLRASPLGASPLLRSMYLARRRSPTLTPAAEFVHGLLKDIAAEDVPAPA